MGALYSFTMSFETFSERITSKETTEIYSALIKFQSLVPVVKKDSENPFHKNHYASLSNIQMTIKKALQECELGYFQSPRGETGLLTRIFHVSGQYIEDIYHMGHDKMKPQDRGSYITYQRRYALASMLGLIIDDGSDDDGHSASTKPPFDMAKVTTAFIRKTIAGMAKDKKDNAYDFLSQYYTISKSDANRVDELRQEYIDSAEL